MSIEVVPYAPLTRYSEPIDVAVRRLTVRRLLVSLGCLDGLV